MKIFFLLIAVTLHLFLSAACNCCLSPEQIAYEANKEGRKVASSLGVTESHREIDPAAVEKMLKLLKEDQPQVFMRHGEQAKSVKAKGLKGAEQKIAMTKLPDNFENGITNASIVELAEAKVVWKYFKDKTKRCFIVESSCNKRAEIPAFEIAKTLNAQFMNNKVLDCINYSDALTTTEILKILPDGTLPWDREKVDLIVGPGMFDHITEDMAKLLSTCRNGTYLGFTHTQQLNAIAAEANLPVARLNHFGLIVITKDHKEVFPEGLYKKLIQKD